MPLILTISNYDTVRELQNIMERAVVVGTTDWVLPVDLPREILSPQPGQSALDPFNLEVVALAAQRAAVERAYAKANGNWKEIAALLGNNRTHVYKVVKNLGLGHLR